jgi:crotonobetainyl-CoA:carnitine CoA-transferase CaiB-like acyl-CoA transferase
VSRWGQTSPTRATAIGTSDALTGLFTVWFTAHDAARVSEALSSTSILWERYRTFADVVTDAKVTDNRCSPR